MSSTTVTKLENHKGRWLCFTYPDLRAKEISKGGKNTEKLIDALVYVYCTLTGHFSTVGTCF